MYSIIFLFPWEWKLTFMIRITLNIRFWLLIDLVICVNWVRLNLFCSGVWFLSICTGKLNVHMTQPCTWKTFTRNYPNQFSDVQIFKISMSNWTTVIRLKLFRLTWSWIRYWTGWSSFNTKCLLQYNVLNIEIFI